MKKSFRTIVCCLLGVLVLSAGASHIKSKPKPALARFFQVQGRDRDLLARRNPEQDNFYDIKVVEGEFTIVVGDMNHPSASDQRVRMEKGDPDKSFRLRSEGEELYVQGHGDENEERVGMGVCVQCKEEPPPSR